MLLKSWLPPPPVTQGHSLLKYRDELLWGGSKCTGAHHRNHLGNKGYSLFLSPFASVQKGRPHHKDLHLWMSLEFGCLIPWYQSGLAVISGRSFAWILMVYWTRDYPCAINQLNRQVASHPLNKSPLIFNKQAIASVKWIYRENFGDTSIAGLLMAYTGLWVTTDWHFSFILILPLWLYWLNTNIQHFNWSAKCQKWCGILFFLHFSKLQGSMVLDFPMFFYWPWEPGIKAWAVSYRDSVLKALLVCWVSSLSRPLTNSGGNFPSPQSKLLVKKKMHASWNTSKPRSTQLVTALGLWSGSREVRLLSYVNFPSPLQFSVLDFYCPDSCWTLGPEQLSDLSFLKMRNGPHVYHHPFNFCLIA